MTTDGKCRTQDVGLRTQWRKRTQDLVKARDLGLLLPLSPESYVLSPRSSPFPLLSFLCFYPTQHAAHFAAYPVAPLSAALHAVRMTERCSVPLSGSHTSPGRPRIWRMFVPSRGNPKRSNLSVAGSKRYTALPAHSLTHTLSRSST